METLWEAIVTTDLGNDREKRDLTRSLRHFCLKFAGAAVD